MTALEEKKTKSELLRVQAAKAEMEYIVAQRQDEIQRLQDNIDKQSEQEQKLLDKLKGNS